MQHSHPVAYFPIQNAAPSLLISISFNFNKSEHLSPHTACDHGSFYIVCVCVFAIHAYGQYYAYNCA